MIITDTIASGGWGGLWPETVLFIPTLCLLIGMNSNKAQQIAAKAGKDLFMGKKYTQIEPDWASWPAKIKPSALFGGI